MESFEEGFLADRTGFEHQVREEVADGQHHVAERRQQPNWERRAREE